EAQQAMVDVAAEGSHARQVAECAADLEVIGIVESGLGAQGATELEVLLDAGVLVVEAEARLDTVGQHAGAEGAGSATGAAPLDQPLDAIGSAEVEVGADDYLEKLAAMERPIEDLRQADFHLHERKLVAIAGPSVGGGKRVRETTKPPTEEVVDVLGRQGV